MDFLEGFVETVEEIDNLIVFASIIWGAVICFFGYRIFRIVIAIIGFFVGGTVTGALGFGWFDGKTLLTCPPRIGPVPMLEQTFKTNREKKG